MMFCQFRHGAFGAIAGIGDPHDEGAGELCAKAEQGSTGIPACVGAPGYTDKNVCATL